MLGAAFKPVLGIAAVLTTCNWLEDMPEVNELEIIRQCFNLQSRKLMACASCMTVFTSSGVAQWKLRAWIGIDL